MRFVFCLLLIAAPAHAFDGQKAAEEYYVADSGCRQFEVNGKDLSQAESDKQCERRAVLASELQNNGYCWDKSEQVWTVCK